MGEKVRMINREKETQKEKEIKRKKKERENRTMGKSHRGRRRGGRGKE